MHLSRLPVPVLPAIGMIAVAAALSSFRVAFAPGVEFYFGPFFYLLALRWFGLRPALAVAFLCMLPTVFWWDHPVSLGLALLHVIWASYLIKRGWTTAGATALFNLTIGVAVGALFLHVFYSLPASMVCVQLLRKLINETLVAAAADCVTLLFGYSPVKRAIVRAREFRLSAAITKSLLLFGMVMTTILFRTEVQFFSLHLTARIHDLDAAVLAQAMTEGGARSKLVIDGTPVSIVQGPPARTEAQERKLVKDYGCRFVEADFASLDEGKRSRFDYWVDGCRVHHLYSRGDHYAYVAPLRSIALDGYELVFAQSFKFLLIVMAAVAAGAVVRRTLATSAERWKEVVAQFGRGEILKTDVAPIAEFQSSIDTFIEANNLFVRMQRERDRTRSTMAKLSEALHLRLIEGIRLDPEHGTLTFRRIDEDGPATEETVQVRRADRHTLIAVGGADEISVEFRIEGDPGDRWHLIVARERTGAHAWASGCIVRLRPARYAIEQLAHHARLTEMGAMASAIGHELRQPLFSISLSAELGLAELGDKSTAEGPHRRFDQIKGQVERARQIIARMSQYARADAGSTEQFRVVDAVSAAVAFLRPMLVAKDVAITVGGDLDPATRIAMRRIGLEQIVVNAVQNSLDSIEARLEQAPGGEKGQVSIDCYRHDDGIEIRICDNGIGLDGITADEAFQAFATTKEVGKGTGLGLYISREIAQEMDGTIELSSIPSGGARFSLLIPAAAVLDAEVEETSEQRAA